MRRLLLSVAIGTALVLAPGSAAAADSWTAALHRGDYSAAAVLLHRSVFEPAPTTKAVDPQALKALAVLYAEGKGVARDRVLACGLARAHAIAVTRAGRATIAATRATQAMVERYCGELPAGDRSAAFAAMSCPRIGLQRHAPIELEPGWTIQFNDRSATVVRNGETREQPLPGGLVCRAQVLLTRHSVVATASRSAQPRHVVEQVTVQSAWRAGTLTRDIVWQLYEVRGLTLDLAAVQRWQEPGSAWPAPALPDAIARGVSFSARGTEIEYAIGDTPPRYGRIEVSRR